MERVHVWAGGALSGVVIFRILWGLIGSRHARFTAFVRSPKSAWRYLVNLTNNRAEHLTGHNPAGGLAIIGLLQLGLATAASGWPLYQDMAGEWLEEGHEFVVNSMLALVIVHLAAVLLGSLAHRENLARAMVTGVKLGSANQAISGNRAWAVPWLLICAFTTACWLSR